MNEPEYAVDKVQRAHRIASACVYFTWLVVAYFDGGFVKSFLVSRMLIIPVLCIWFSSAMAMFTNAKITEPSHPMFLRWAGWFVLLVVPVFLAIVSR